MAERDLVEKVKRELKRQGVYAVKTTPPATEKGTPDILACVDGVFVGLELKQPGKHRDRMQAHRAEQIERAGGLAFEIHDLKELAHALARARDLSGSREPGRTGCGEHPARSSSGG